MDRPHPTDIVAWIGKGRPRSEGAQIIFDVVVGRRLTRFAEVTEAVAAELLTRDCRRAGMDHSAERLRRAYVGAAGDLLRSQVGILIRIVRSETKSPLSHVESGAATPGNWRRQVGLYAALGGFLAAFQHVMQRHVFQGHAPDVSSILVLAVYVVIGVLGVLWLHDSRARVEDMPAPRTGTTP